MNPFRDSNLDPAWLAQAMADNPPMIKEDGTLVSGPVRIGYCQVMRAGKASRGDDGNMREGKFECEALYPFGMEGLGLFYNAWYQEARSNPKTSGRFNPDGSFNIGQGGLQYPFRDQREKSQKPGYTPGLIFHKASTERQPLVVDANYNQIQDPRELYSGCWAILCMNLYPYNNRMVGVGFGLLTFMKIADDLHTYNASSNSPQQAFAGVKITPNYSPKNAMMGAGGGAPLPGQPARGPSPMPQSYGQPSQPSQGPVAPSYPAQQGGYAPPPPPPGQPQSYGQAPQGYNAPPPAAPGVAMTPPQGYQPPGQPGQAPQGYPQPQQGGFPAPQGASPPPPPPPPPGYGR